MSLDFIYSEKKRKNIEDILYDNHPSHSARCYLVSFLFHVCHMSSRDIQRLIKVESNWNDYTDTDTAKQVEHLCGGEQTGFVSSEDPPFVSECKKEVGYRPCKDTSIFGKLNKRFFLGAKKCSYEYSLDCFNVHGRMKWQPLLYPIYRTIENIDGSILFYIDLDTEPECGGSIELTWDYAQQLYDLYDWDGAKFSGSKGVHLFKIEMGNTRKELYNKAHELYNQIETNLTFFGYSEINTKPVLVDVSAYNKHRFVRGYCRNYKGTFSIPIDFSLSCTEIIKISKDIYKIKEYLNEGKI